MLPWRVPSKNYFCPVTCQLNAYFTAITDRVTVTVRALELRLYLNPSRKNGNPCK